MNDRFIVTYEQAKKHAFKPWLQVLSIFYPEWDFSQAELDYVKGDNWRCQWAIYVNYASKKHCELIEFVQAMKRCRFVVRRVLVGKRYAGLDAVEGTPVVYDPTLPADEFVMDGAP